MGSRDCRYAHLLDSSDLSGVTGAVDQTNPRREQILSAIVAEKSAEILRLTDRSYALGHLQHRCDPDAIVLTYAAAESVELPNRHGLGPRWSTS